MVVWLVLGCVLTFCGIAGIIDDFWCGMGGGFIGVGIVQLIRFHRYDTNAEYREKVDVAIQDERNKFISGRAWAWAGYLFILIAGISIVPLKLMGREDLMMMASGSICLMITLYWICYLFLKRKY